MSLLGQLAEMGLSPRVILNHLAPDLAIPADTDISDIWAIIASIIEPPKRKKLPQFNTLEDAVNLIKSSSNILVIAGAGMSTSAGLPDFRSPNGIYVQIHEQHPDLSDPKSLFDIEYFKKNPLPFYQFAKALFPGQFQPTIGHLFIKCLEDHKKLLRNYSQNIDTLEKQAEIKRVIECHGSFAKATCTNCEYSVDGEDIRTDIFEQRVPICPKCRNLEDGPQDGLGVLKPNIVFFGENLGRQFDDSLEQDKDKADLVIVIGSSLKVRPVALIPRMVPASIPQILINKEPLNHMSFDIELLGDCDHIIQELCLRLGEGWTHLCKPGVNLLQQLNGQGELSILNKQPVSETIVTHETADLPASNKESAIDICDEKNESDSDWEDIEILDDDSLFSPEENIKLHIPEGSFVHLEPNKYIFKGAELTRNQYEDFMNLVQ